MGILLHFLSCFGRRKSCGEADGGWHCSASCKANPVSWPAAVGIWVMVLLGDLCSSQGAVWQVPFPQAIRHHTLPSWLEIHGVVNSLLRKWEPLGTVVWGCVRLQKNLPALWGACPGANTSSLACWQQNMESASWAQSWSSNDVDVCVLPGMQTVFSDTADKRWMEWK